LRLRPFFSGVPVDLGAFILASDYLFNIWIRAVIAKIKRENGTNL